LDISFAYSKNIEGKWGDIKVSGFIDHFKIETRNLAPIKGEDKINMSAI
jgi:hypothetical protein